MRIAPATVHVDDQETLIAAHEGRLLLSRRWFCGSGYGW